MDKIMNIGIIGAGVVAERIINAASVNPRANIKSIYDVNQTRLSEVSYKYNLQVEESQNMLLSDPEIDIIYLAVPPKYHYPIGLEIFKSGKHFICEKPLANSTDEAKAMSDLSKENHIVCAMNFPTMYSNTFHKIQTLIKENFLGNIVRIEFQGYFSSWPRTWQQNDWISTREQGGFVREVVTHYIQMIQRLFGEIKDITSFIQYPDDPKLSETSIIAKGHINKVPVLINALAGIGMKEDLNLKLIGTTGVIYLKNWRELWLSNEDMEMEKMEVAESNGLVELLNNVFNEIEGKKSNIVDFTEGYKTHKVIEKLLDSKSTI